MQNEKNETFHEDPPLRYFGSGNSGFRVNLSGLHAAAFFSACEEYNLFRCEEKGQRKKCGKRKQQSFQDGGLRWLYHFSGKECA